MTKVTINTQAINNRLAQLDLITDEFACSPLNAPNMTEDQVLDRIHQVGLEAFQDEILMGIAAEEASLEELLNLQSQPSLMY